MSPLELIVISTVFITGLLVGRFWTVIQYTFDHDE